MTHPVATPPRPPFAEGELVPAGRAVGRFGSTGSPGNVGIAQNSACKVASLGRNQGLTLHKVIGAIHRGGHLKFRTAELLHFESVRLVVAVILTKAGTIGTEIDSGRTQVYIVGQSDLKIETSAIAQLSGTGTELSTARIL